MGDLPLQCLEAGEPAGRQVAAVEPQHLQRQSTREQAQQTRVGERLQDFGVEVASGFGLGAQLRRPIEGLVA